MSQEVSGGQHSPPSQGQRPTAARLVTASFFLTEQTAAADARLCCAAQHPGARCLTTGLSLTPATGICPHFAKNELLGNSLYLMLNSASVQCVQILGSSCIAALDPRHSRSVSVGTESSRLNRLSSCLQNLSISMEGENSAKRNPSLLRLH